MTPDLARRIALTLGALLLYRLGTYITLPGIDVAAWAGLMHSQPGGALAQANLLSGGAMGRLSIFSLSLTPYLTATFLLQLVALVSRRLRDSWTASDRRRAIAERRTQILAAVIAAIQSYGVAKGLTAVPELVVRPDGFVITTVLILTGGVLFLIWLSGQITRRGIGNGIALIFLAGVVSLLPSQVALALELVREGLLSANAMLVGFLLVVALGTLVVVVERARRRLPTRFAERRTGTATLPSRSADLVLKLNPAGIMPVVLASWLLMILLLPAALAGGPHGGWVTELLHALSSVFSPLHHAVTLVLILFLTFVYTAFVCDPTDMAEKLNKHGGVIEDIAPGEATAAHLDRVLSRIATLGATYLVFVVLLSFVLTNYFIAFAPVLSTFFLGSTSLMVFVCATLDIEAQVRAHLAQPRTR